MLWGFKWALAAGALAYLLLAGMAWLVMRVRENVLVAS